MLAVAGFASAASAAHAPKYMPVAAMDQVLEEYGLIMVVNARSVDRTALSVDCEGQGIPHAGGYFHLFHCFAWTARGLNEVHVSTFMTRPPRWSYLITLIP
jgi:hypothetical protein